MKKRTFLVACLLAALLTACAGTQAPSVSPTIDLATASVEFALEIKGDPHALSMVPDVALDSQGNLLVIDGNNNRIQKFDSNGRFLSTWGSEGAGDGEFRFSSPSPPEGWGGVAVDAHGHVYVADSVNARIQKFDSEGHFLAKWGEEGMGDGQFFFPAGIAVDAQGNVYVSDSRREDIQKFDSEGHFLTKWPNLGGASYALWIAVDEQGNVYVPNMESDEVRKFDSEGNLLKTFGGPGAGDGEFRDPVAVAVDHQGSVYVVEDIGLRVQKFDSEGNFLRGWGSRGSGDGDFRSPKGLVVDVDGSVYVADWGNERVQKFRQQ